MGKEITDSEQEIETIDVADTTATETSGDEPELDSSTDTTDAGAEHSDTQEVDAGETDGAANAEPDAAETAADAQKQDDEPESRSQKRRRQRRDSLAAARQEAEKAKAEAQWLREKGEQAEAAGDYDRSDTYTRMHTETNIKQEQAAERAAAAEVDVRAEIFEEQAAALPHIKDLNERLTDPSLNLSQDTAVLALDESICGERGVETLYKLATDASLRAEIDALPLPQRAARLATIAKELSTVKPKKESKAPEPLDRVSGKNANVEVDLEKASYADYRRARGLD